MASTEQRRAPVELRCENGGATGATEEEHAGEEQEEFPTALLLQKGRIRGGQLLKCIAEAKDEEAGETAGRGLEGESSLAEHCWQVDAVEGRHVGGKVIGWWWG